MTDPALITAAAKGDSEALERLVRELAPSVYAYLVGMLGDEPEAETGMQEAFVRVARAVERYDPAVDPEAWVFGIARRVAADIRPTPAAPPGEVPPSDGEVVEWAKRSLRALPADLREVVVLKELLRWAPERIASVVGIESSEVPKRLLAAHTRLAEGMQEQTARGPS